MPFGTAHEHAVHSPESEHHRTVSAALQALQLPARVPKPPPEPSLPPAKVLSDHFYASAERVARLFELSGQSACARTSTAVSWLLNAQAQGGLTAWIQPTNGSLFPPDLAKAGVDLRSLVIIQVPAGHALIRATEMLLRSGAFGLVVVDLTDALPLGAPSRWQGRLQALLRKHDCRVCLLTSSELNEPSAGPLVELRLHTTRERRGPGRARIHHEILKNKVGIRARISDANVATPAGL